MNIRIFIIFAIFGVLALEPLVVYHDCSARAALSGPVTQGVKRIISIFSSRGRQSLSELAGLGGETMVRRVVDRTMHQGGNQAVENLTRLTRAHGSDALLAADNAVNVPKMIRAVDGLPQDMGGPALRRLSGSQGKALAGMVDQYGSIALKSEVLHPGIGIRAMNSMGKDGAVLVSRLSRDEAVAMGRHMKDIGRLPESQKQDLIRLLHSDIKGMLNFTARFVENNPGKVLFTAASTAVILKHSDASLGDSEIVFDDNGSPHVVTKPGVIERSMNSVLKPIISSAVYIFGSFAFLLLSVKLWFYYKKCRYEHNLWIQGKISEYTITKHKEV